MSHPVLQSFDYAGLMEAHARAGTRYLEFLRVPAMSAGIYKLAAGSTDPQKPHAEDEVYYVISGRSKFTCDGKTIDAVAGSTIYVAARAEHRFHDIEEDLVILVFFAPAEVE
jgi:mannose-6-phosphate isomerase-like protein (cupin superfamily)